MEVENYTTDFGQWNATRNCRVIKRAPGAISKRAYARILREAKRDYLSGFGLDWSQFDDGALIFDDMTTCQADFTHKESGRIVTLTCIYFEHRTGEILQAGSEYSLTL